MGKRSSTHRRKLHSRRRRGGGGCLPSLSPFTLKRGGGQSPLQPFSLSGGDSEGASMPKPTLTEGKTGGPPHTKQAGGHRCKSKKGRRRGGGMLATAAVPFGLFGLQKYFRGSRSTRKGVRRFSKSVGRTLRRF